MVRAKFVGRGAQRKHGALHPGTGESLDPAGAGVLNRTGLVKTTGRGGSKRLALM